MKDNPLHTNELKNNILFAIEQRDKIFAENLYRSGYITIKDLVDIIIEIDESVTDYYKFKKWITSFWK